MESWRAHSVIHVGVVLQQGANLLDPAGVSFLAHQILQFLGRREKNADQFHGFDDKTQFLDISLKAFDVVTLFSGVAIMHTGVAFLWIEPIKQPRRYTVNRGGNTFDRSPKGWVLPMARANHANCVFHRLRRKNGLEIVHITIFSKVGAS